MIKMRLMGPWQMHCLNEIELCFADNDDDEE